MTQFSRTVFWLENLIFFWCGLTLILVIGQDNLLVPPWIQVFGRIHPLILHFPIVLLLMAVAFSWLPKKQWVESGRFLLLLGTNLAGITVVAGLILASEDYEGNSLNWHKWLGITSFTLSIGIYFLLKHQSKSLKYSTSALAVALLLTGHFGANLTHGSDFLLAPLLVKEAQMVSMDDAEVFRDMVQPIFEAKCISCHNEGKFKGELRLDHIEGLKKGGESGPFFLPGDPENSLFLQKIHLPLEDEDHMPPKNKSQLTEEEIETLKLWVTLGGDFEKKVAELDESTPLFQLASQRFKTEKAYSFSPANDSDIKKLNGFFRKVNPVYPGSPALEVSYFGSSTFDPKSLSDLKKVKEQVVKLNLNRMPLSEVDLKFLADFKNLEELQLNFTGVIADQLGLLEKTNSLQTLAISGNQLGSESLSALKKLGSLKKLFFWESGLTEQEKKSLQASLTNTKIDFGFDSKGVILQLNPPKIEVSERMFLDSIEVNISHPIRTTEIRYTLDGTEPDSLNSLLYTQPIFLKSSGIVRAKAFAPEWIGSLDTKSSVYKKGRNPKSFTLTFEPHQKYKAKGAETLFDGVKGKANHTSGEWLGFTDHAMEIQISLESGHLPTSIQTSLLLNEGAYIFPPEDVELWIGKAGKWKKIGQEKPLQPLKAQQARFDILKMELPDEDFDQIKLRLQPISKLPKWHQGAGSKGWVFVDEIFLY
jgi:uncharacterized membrane protein